jgi:cell division protein FtsW (lipid II flippase)
MRPGQDEGWEGMKTNIKNTTLWMILLGVGTVLTPVIYLSPRQDFFEVLNAICSATSLGVCAGYAPTTWRALKMPPHKMTAAHMVIVAGFIVCASLAEIFIIQWFWRANGKPDWIIDSWFTVQSRVTLSMGLFLYLATNFSRNGEIVVGAYKRIAVLVTITALIAAFLVWMGWG